jgi:hypothetical protein
LSGVIQASDHNIIYVKNRYTDDDNYDEDGDNDDEQEENIFQVAGIYVT